MANNKSFVSKNAIFSAIPTVIGIFLLALLLTPSASSMSFAQTSSNQTLSNIETQTQPPARLGGSVQASNEIAKLIQSLANVTLVDATQMAVESVGENASAQSSNLAVENGSLVYKVSVINPDGVSHLLTIDAGNGEVLSDTVLSAVGPIITGNLPVIPPSGGGGPISLVHVYPCFTYADGRTGYCCADYQSGQYWFCG